MNDYPTTAYVEGNTLGGGWSYRINRVIKNEGQVAYSALLTHEDRLARADRLYLWLAEFDTLDEARRAATEVLGQWSAVRHPALEA